VGGGTTPGKIKGLLKIHLKIVNHI